MNCKTKIFISIATSCLFIGCATKKVNISEEQNRPMTEIDSVSYAFGLLNGKSFSSYINNVDSTMNNGQIIAGFRDALEGASDSLYNANAELFENWAKAKEERRIDSLKKKSQSYLDENKTKEGVKETKSGLQYKILRDSDGERPTVQDTVIVDYEGRLADGTVFDSSYKRGQSAEFPLLSVIPGWTEGICLMPIGGKYQFTIPYSLAYGDKGAGNVIPPYSTLVFDVELKGIKKFKEPESKEDVKTQSTTRSKK